MDYSNVKWINQSLYFFLDKEFEKSRLELSVSLSTSDHISFSQPKFSISISVDQTSVRNNYRLDYSNVLDLLESMNTVGKNINEIYKNPQSGDITKRYVQDKDLVFEFRISSGSKQPVVIIRIVSGPDEEVKIVVPFSPVFITIGKFLRIFQENYVKFCLDLPSRYMMSVSYLKMINIETALKVLPTQIAPVYQSQNKVEIEKFPDGEKQPTGKLCSVCHKEQFMTSSGLVCDNGHGGADSVETSSGEFEKFMDDNIDKIRIPELESTVVDPKQPITQEYTSRFIDKTLKGDIQKFEQMINASTTGENPLNIILRNIDDRRNIDDNLDWFPGMTEEITKSHLYISNLFFKAHFYNYTINNQPLPTNIPVVKYKPTEIHDYNKELSNDMFMIGAYLKIYRSIRESKDQDVYQNGALVHFSTRCFLDIISFSFINGENTEIFKGNIISRFKYFKEKGFFKYYDKQLVENNCPEVNTKFIEEYINKVIENLSTLQNIDERHKDMFNSKSVKIPPNNKFTIEQITNDLVIYEVKIAFGQTIENLTDDKDIIEFFNKSGQKPDRTDHRPKKIEPETHITRWVRLKILDNPERYRDSFIEYIKGIGDEKYDFFNKQFPMEELGESIIKGLYVWNEYKGETIKYTDFCLYCEECIEKNMIIAKMKENENKEEEVDEEWNFGNLLT